MYAFIRALEVGADGIGFDLEAAGDETLVVMHNVTLDRPDRAIHTFRTERMFRRLPGWVVRTLSHQERHSGSSVPSGAGLLAFW